MTADPFVRSLRTHADQSGSLRPRARILLAVSGGVASTALAHAVASLRSALSLQLRIVHVPHDAFEERVTHVRALARHLQLPVAVLPPVSTAADVLPALLAFATDRATGWRIAVGDTRDHVEEQFLLRVLEGADLDTLADLPPGGGLVTRPLALFSREDCRAFLDRQALPFVPEPEKLALTGKTRRVGLLLLPLIRHHIQSTLSEDLARGRALLREDAALLQALAEAARIDVGWRVRPGGEVSLDAGRFQRLPGSLRRRLLAAAGAALRVPPLTTEELRGLERAVMTPDASRQTAVGALRVTRSGDTLLLHRA